MLDKLAKRLIQPLNTSVISIMGAFNLLLGIWLLMPWDSLNKYNADGLEFMLGAILAAIGISIISGAIKENVRALGTGAIVGFLFWIMVTGLATTHIKNVDWIFTLMIAVYHGFVGLNIMVNTRNLPNKK